MAEIGSQRATRGAGRWVLATLGLVCGTLALVAGVAVAPPPAQALGDNGLASISSSDDHSCGITAAGAAYCWGASGLGNGTSTRSLVPVPVTGLSSGVTAISAGNGHSCAVVSGAAWCWGTNSSGELGNNTTTFSNVPVAVTGLSSGVTAISAGNDHSCAAVSGAAVCWGSNTSGRLGNGSTTRSLVPVAVTGLTSGIGSITAGAQHSCASASGAAWCWGENGDGELGNNGSTDSSIPVSVTGLSSGVTTLSAGANHSCAVVSGSARCWGYNTFGRLGNNSTTTSRVPVQVSGLTSGVTAVAAGNVHSCAVVSGAARCWGFNELGALGNGTTTTSRVPVAPTGLASGVTAISAGLDHSCAVVSGAVRCWGTNPNGELGNGTATDTFLPMAVPGLSSGVTAISSGNDHNCAVVAAAAKCWGLNLYGQLGNGTSSAIGSTPVQVSGLTSGVTVVSAGYIHSCAIVSGAARCWGSNGSGRLGSVSSSASSTPVAVQGMSSGVTAIAAGGDHTCAVRSGAAYCWGSNALGQLGSDPAVVTSSPSPLLVPGLTTGVTAIAVGTYHSCAVVSGTVRCWGYNGDGQLGNNSTVSTGAAPVTVSGISSGATAVGTGWMHSCALVSGAVRCWGLGTSGLLGTVFSDNSLVPVTAYQMGSGVTSLAVSWFHSCAVVSGGARCWGSNEYGALGSGTTSPVFPGTPVSGLTSGVTAVSAGIGHSCALVTNSEVTGAASCWGEGQGLQTTDPNPLVPGEVSGGLTWASGIPAAPTITGSRSPAANPAGWNNEPVVVSFTCTSPAVAWCSAPVTVSADGADQSVSGTVTDTASQTASTTVSGISIDQVAPLLAGVATAAPNEAGWHRAPVPMTWTCSDARSGIAPGACPAESSTTGEGEAVTVSASVLDRAGNQTTASSESEKVDLTKPSTGVSSPPTWSSSDVTLALTPVDALSGVDTTQYRVDGGPTQTGTAPVVSGQGVHAVEFWSTDVAGNVENAQTVQVRIDVQAPSITASVSPAPNAAGWNNGPVTVTFECGDSDGGSGVASCTAPQTIDDEVDTSVTGTVTDTAGNTASVQQPVRIDRTAPTVQAQVPAANANGWFNEPVQVPFTCADSGGSGIATCPVPVVFAGEGADQPVVGEASDAAGNTGAASGATVSLDTTAPTISGAGVEPANADGGYFGAVTVRWTCADALSGVVACPADVVVSGEGVHVVSRSVTDRAGNTSTAETTIRIDHDPSTDPGTVHGTITDSGSGAVVAGATVTLRTPSNTIAATTTTGTDGTYTFAAVADGSYKIYAAKTLTHQGSYRPGLFTVAHGTGTTADHVLAPTLALSGTVRSAGGTPIAGATVRVAPSSLVAVTDADGRYQVAGLLPGPITVKVLATGYVAPADVPLTISGPRTLDVSLQAATAGGGLKGTVTAQASGAPLAGATVRIWLKGSTVFSQTVSTGADGRYSVPSLAVGTYEVDVVRTDYQVRWFGDALSRSGAAPIAISTGCTAAPDTAWGDPCAFAASIALRR